VREGEGGECQATWLRDDCQRKKKGKRRGEGGEKRRWFAMRGDGRRGRRTFRTNPRLWRLTWTVPKGREKRERGPTNTHWRQREKKVSCICSGVLRTPVDPRKWKKRGGMGLFPPLGKKEKKGKSHRSSRASSSASEQREKKKGKDGQGLYAPFL